MLRSSSNTHTSRLAYSSKQASSTWAKTFHFRLEKNYTMLPGEKQSSRRTSLECPLLTSNVTARSYETSVVCWASAQSRMACYCSEFFCLSVSLLNRGNNNTILRTMYTAVTGSSFGFSSCMVSSKLIWETIKGFSDNAEGKKHSRACIQHLTFDIFISRRASFTSSSMTCVKCVRWKIISIEWSSDSRNRKSR